MSSPLPFIRGRRARAEAVPKQAKPSWLKVRAPGSARYSRLKSLMREQELHTVCEEANCPNIGECWHHGTATFMILGDVCTRACGYCNVVHGRPAAVDREEPARVARAAETMGLDYAVVTSVDRDDLDDYGSSIFAATIREVRARVPACRIEVLIPDLKGSDTALRTVLDARPDVLNHNIETVPRIFRQVRPGGRYERSLELLRRARAYAPDIPTKSGLMVGLGEEWAEVLETIGDLRRAGVTILTIGQYLRPSQANVPTLRYYHPDEFAELRRHALALGFLHAECGPLVRSSYHAHEQAQGYDEAIGTRRSADDPRRPALASGETHAEQGTGLGRA